MSVTHHKNQYKPIEEYVGRVLLPLWSYKSRLLMPKAKAHAAIAITIEPSASAVWVWAVPQYESDYNGAYSTGDKEKNN